VSAGVANPSTVIIKEGKKQQQNGNARSPGTEENNVVVRVPWERGDVQSSVYHEALLEREGAKEKPGIRAPGVR
jgi:hypothetical protein